MAYVAPNLLEKIFTCPHCGAITEHRWYSFDWENKQYGFDDDAIRHSICVPCKGATIWLIEKMIFPDTGYFCISPQKGIFQRYQFEGVDPDRDTNSCTIASISIGWNDLVNS